MSDFFIKIKKDTKNTNFSTEFQLNLIQSFGFAHLLE